MRSILIKDTTREEREKIVREALFGACGSECEFCSGCDNLGGGRIPQDPLQRNEGLKSRNHMGRS